MADLSTNYLGMNLKSPLIVGSCGLTTSLENVKLMEKNGAGAIVLKSVFEEEILLSLHKKARDASKDKLLYYEYSETYDYLDIHTRNEELENYLQFIREIKKEVLMPVIASINCVTDTEWTDFAMKIQEAGADALELNLFFNPTGFKIMDVEKKSVQIVKKILKTVSIPVSVKLSSNYTNLGHTIQEISEKGVQGIVLFNRFFSVDFDLDKLSVISSDIYSSPGDFTKPLRWIALITDKIGCNIAASGGVHSGKTALKQILAGADAVQVVSILYKNGIDHLSVLLNEMDKWIEKKGFNSVSQIKGMMSNKNVKNPEVFERMQFMRYYGKLFD
ncbi:dihydroorotate dehydrogenase-like protein [Maribellus comscasis]|uniref:dihydrouracil dehydrogenase (NAD(+)) n=1 Tax=Maribellus comscasis TaxID=2681766 RepID=A0A6I6K2U2_9BACT|nr:dihydroorotate dehydrogenase-like protein [Maribellus comscasis]QGY45853.1 dihydroorotate dehydrogenase-like protein [Maribellus comscasis]